MCPWCKSPFSRVIATERYDTCIRRRRQCRSCGGKFYGCEKYDGMIEPPPGKAHHPPPHPETGGNPAPLIAASGGN